MNPKHTKENKPRQVKGDSRKGISDHDVYAYAPYNFVPLPEAVVKVVSEQELAQLSAEEQHQLLNTRMPGHDRYQRYTGYIECELVTQSPLYIRGMMTQATFEEVGDKSFHDLDDNQKEERAKFFMLRDGEPVIPGSSLRGMIRSLVEIAGYGKVQPVTGEPLVYRAVGDTTSLGKEYRDQLLREIRPRTYEFQVKAGYMRHKGKNWYIAPAISNNQTLGQTFFRVEIRSLDALRNRPNWYQFNSNHCFQLSFEPVAPREHPHNKDRNGNPRIFLRYAKVERLNNQHLNNATFIKGIAVQSGNSPRKHMQFIFTMPDEDESKWIKVTDELRQRYEDQKTDGQNEIVGGKGVLQDWCPVFYKTDMANQLIFFGHTAMFRLPYKKSPQSFVPEQLYHEKDIDLAEAIFGYTKSGDISEGKQRAYAGRIFVNDARLMPNQRDVLMDGGTMLTPQILGSPKPTTFQHYLVQPDAREKRNLKHYASETPAETVIRGHKLYWHRDNVTRRDIEIEADKRERAVTQLTGIKPVRAGIRFNFRIHFENLNSVELGALLWVLNLPEKHYPKLGMGKPLGMGAVKITPQLVLSNRSKRYSQLFEGDDWARGESQADDLNQFKQAFEKFVLNGMDETERRGAATLDQVERIKMLLEMLNWPGPQHSLTEYMTIEPENQFKERPVLPDPLRIDPSPDHKDASARSDSSHQPTRRQFTPQQPARQHPTTETDRQTLSKPTQAGTSQITRPVPAKSSPKLPEVGDVFTEKIIKIRPNGDIVIQYKSLPSNQVAIFIAAGDLGGKKYQEGNLARCEVIEKYQEGEKWILKCKPAPKQERR